MPVVCNFVCDQVLVVNQFHLECLRRGVLILSDELFGELSPHQRFRLSVRTQIVSALADDALVQFVQVDVSDANFRFSLKSGSVFTLSASRITSQLKHTSRHTRASRGTRPDLS